MTRIADEEASYGAFLTAFMSVDRTAWQRWFKTQGIDKTDTIALERARAQWEALPLLRLPELTSLVSRALEASRGRLLSLTDGFTASLWTGGATDTINGRYLSDFSFVNFVNLLHERAQVLAPKRTGWVIEPTTNPTGQRTNQATLAMHALFLDCDGTGTWNKLLGTLASYNYAFVAYQSGGWTPEKPKWRIVLPLHAPHDTTTEQGRRTWKIIYNSARIILGAAGDLLSVGFDPATETPCNPWFLTEKRNPEDPPRQIIARFPGHTFDLTALALTLPEISTEAPEYTAQSSTSTLTLSEARLNEIIDALAAVTNHVPVGRRDLYLALPGVLLDRGVPPDDVFAIIEAVSASYPRHHAEKHADNLHNARTTIGRWEAKTHYTRIGVLNTVAPDVAAVIDRILPDLAAKGIADNVQAQLSQYTKPAIETKQVVISPRVPKLNEFGKEASKLASKLKLSKKDDWRLSGLLLEHFIKGIELPKLSNMSIDEMVCRVMKALGRGMVLTSTWPDALDFALRSLSAMDFTQSKERVAAAEHAFYEGRGARGRANQKKQNEFDQIKQKQEQYKKERAFIDSQKRVVK